MNNATKKTGRTIQRTISETEAYEAMRLAQIHEHQGVMASSAKSCAEDAAACFNNGDFSHCYDRARESLRYSVGAFHKDCLPAR